MNILPVFFHMHVWKAGFFVCYSHPLRLESGTHLLSGAYTELGDLRGRMEAGTLSANSMQRRAQGRLLGRVGAWVFAGYLMGKPGFPSFSLRGPGSDAFSSLVGNGLGNGGRYGSRMMEY